MKKIIIMTLLIIICQGVFAIEFVFQNGKIYGMKKHTNAPNIINIPNGVTDCSLLDFTLGSFERYIDLEKIKAINIPATVTKIEIGNMHDCYYSLNAINVNKNNKYFCSVNGVLYNKNKTKLIRVPQAIKNKIFTIPKEVKEIDTFAFANCSNIKTIKASKELNSWVLDNLKENYEKEILRY